MQKLESEACNSYIKAAGVNIPAIHGYLWADVITPLTIRPPPLLLDSPHAKYKK